MSQILFLSVLIFFGLISAFLGTYPWGIKVERVEVKDIRLPRELTRVLAAEAEASREADAKIVHAAGELNVNPK